ncbi:hypothetical protein Tco_0964574 [Tanacetum coccineum]
MDSPEVHDGSDIWKNQHTWSIQRWKLYSFSGIHVLETVSGLILPMFVDKKYPLSVNLIERMLDHQLEICHGTVGNELTTAVQLIAFLKNKFLIPSVLRFMTEFMKVAAFGVHAVNFLMLLQRLSPAIIRFLIQEVWSWFQDVAVQSSGIVTTSRYVVPTGRVKVPAGRYVVPTGKDNVIVSAGRSKVIPAGRTILVLSHMVLGIAPVAIIDRQLPFEYTITSRSTDVVVMAQPVQNINHSAFRSMFEREKLSGNNFNDWFRQLKLVLRVEKKMYVIEQPLPAAPAADSEAQVLSQWNAVYDAYNEVACLILGRGSMTFGGGDGKITGKGTIRTSKLNFENVYYVEELQNFNLFSVSQICDTKNKVLFTDKECLVLSKEYVVPTGRVKVPAGRYVVPTGKDNVIVSTGRTKVIPAGRTILVLVVLCLL